jgi:hypothetical protein
MQVHGDEAGGGGGGGLLPTGLTPTPTSSPRSYKTFSVTWILFHSHETSTYVSSFCTNYGHNSSKLSNRISRYCSITSTTIKRQTEKNQNKRDQKNETWKMTTTFRGGGASVMWRTQCTWMSRSASSLLSCSSMSMRWRNNRFSVLSRCSGKRIIVTEILRSFL